MRILVTGATGKVGSRLAKRLAQRGELVRALVRDPTRAADLHGAGVELAQGDLLDPTSLSAAVRGVDAVVHCAAFFRGATAEQAHAVNDLGTQHLASAARAANVKRFIFTSTGLVYGSNGGRLAGEDDPCAPTAAYPACPLPNPPPADRGRGPDRIEREPKRRNPAPLSFTQVHSPPETGSLPPHLRLIALDLDRPLFHSA